MYLGRMCIPLSMGGMFYRYILGIVGLWGCSILVDLLIVLSIIKNEVMKSPTIIIELSVLPLVFRFYLIDLGSCYNCFIILIYPFIIIKCPSLSLVTIFVLKSLLFDTSTATPTLFWLWFSQLTFPIFLLHVFE